jgi:hypothetical protein
LLLPQAESATTAIAETVTILKDFLLTVLLIISM